MIKRYYSFLGLLLLSFSANSTGHFYYGFNYFYRDYSEKLVAPAKSDEYGLLMGLVLGYRSIKPKAPFYDLNTDMAYGNVTYDGATLALNPSSNTIPVTHRTDSFIANIDSKFGFNISHLDNRAIAPFIGAGYHYWYRSLFGLQSERYYWPYVSIGVVTNFTIDPTWSAGVNIKLMHMVNGKMRARMVSIRSRVNGLSDYENFRLGNKPQLEIEFPITYNETAFYNNSKIKIYVDIIPYYKNMNIGKSNEIDATRISDQAQIYFYEPASSTHVIGLKLLFYFL